MANLKNINFMSQDRFESTEQVDDELYAVQFGFMPDYSAGVSLSTTADSEYIAPQNGIILCNAIGDNMRCYCYIDFYDENDNLIAIIGNDKNATSSAASIASLVFPINAGQRVKVNAFAGTTKIYNFYPFKGVN